MTLTAPETGMSPLRRAAEAAEEATGLRAEIIRGLLMMSPTPPGKHAGTINVVYDQLTTLGEIESRACWPGGSAGG